MNRFYVKQTGPRCWQVYDRHASMLSAAKGSKARSEGKITAYVSERRAKFCVWRLESGRQKSPFDHRLRRLKAWPAAASPISASNTNTTPKKQSA